MKKITNYALVEIPNLELSKDIYFCKQSSIAVDSLKTMEKYEYTRVFEFNGNFTEIAQNGLNKIGESVINGTKSIYSCDQIL
jgi:hypothetical protein